MARVVFICARNAVRSPMAEALWNAGGPDEAISCGIAPAGFPDGHMISVMDELGLDLSEFECKGVDAVSGAPSHVICLTRDIAASARAFADQHGAQFHLWPIPDPALAGGVREARLEAYRAAREAIRAHIAAFRDESG